MKREPRPAEKDRLFRRMEWYFVWLPPLLIAFFAVFGGLFLAWIVPVRGVDLWIRWAVIAPLLVLVPLVGRLLARAAKRDPEHPDT